MEQQDSCELQVTFVKACARGCVDTVKTFLQSSTINVNQVLETGSPPFKWTGLMYACRNLQLDTVKVLLEHEADPNYTTNGGFTPIMAAVVASSKELDDSAVACVKLLKNAGANVNNWNVFNKRTLLTRAVFKESKVLVEYFASTGADVNIRDAYGETPFNLAVSRNLFSIADTLVKLGANPFLRNKNGACARTLCVTTGSSEARDEMLLNIYAWELKYYETHFRKGKLHHFKQMMVAINNERYITDKNNNIVPAPDMQAQNGNKNENSVIKKTIAKKPTEKFTQTQGLVPTTLNIVRNASGKLANKVTCCEKLVPNEDQLHDALSFHTREHFQQLPLTPEESPNSETESANNSSLPSPQYSPPPPSPPDDEQSSTENEDKNPPYWLLICSVLVLIVSLKICSSASVKKS